MINSKLAKFAPMRVVNDSQNVRGSAGIDELIVVSKSKEKTSHVLRFSIHRRAIKQLGWMKGDRIDMEVTESGALILYRGPKGRTLGEPGDSKGNRMYCRFRVISEFYEAIDPQAGKNVEIADGRIAFEL